ncbi:hypothetical protein BKA70DRAFT_1394678 [Coprinopsis sp. MPI-PUGE-AT-0042]|nr:hypothetical protein BKA70DRAFT_1394678 [Coprinopsis sp. MPI-PUGE-AT-0042]
MSAPPDAPRPPRFATDSEELYTYLVFFSLPNVANPKILGFDANEKKDDFVNMVLKKHQATIIDGWLEVPTIADWIECLHFAGDAGAMFLELPKTPDAKAYTHGAHLCMPDFKRRGLWLFATEEAKDEWVKTMLTFPDTRVIDNWLEVSTKDQLETSFERAKEVNGVDVENYPSPDSVGPFPVAYKVHFCVDGDGFRTLLQTITFHGHNDEKKKEFVVAAEQTLGAFEREGFLQVKDEAKLLEGDQLAVSLGGVVSFYDGFITQAAALLPNPFSVGFEDAQGHRAGITFKAILQKAEWIAYVMVACGARRVGGDPSNYQSPTPGQWALGLWKARSMGAEVTFYPIAADATFPPLDFDLATAALLVKGSTSPRQLVFFPTSEIIADYIQKLKDMGVVDDVAPYDITLVSEEDLAKADALATQLGGAFMDYPEEPEPPLMYIVYLSWPMARSEATIYFPSLLTMRAFICIMTKIRHGVETGEPGLGIPISVNGAQDWDYGIQLAYYLGGKLEGATPSQIAEFSQTGFVAIHPSSVGWIQAGSPESYRKLTFDSEEIDAQFQRWAVFHLGANLVFDPQSQDLYLEVPSRLAWVIGIFEARSKGGRVESDAAELTEAEYIGVPFFLNFCTVGFGNKQHIVFPSAAKGEAFVAKMKTLGAVYVLGWLQVLDVKKQKQGDEIARQMGGFVINNPTVVRSSADGKTASVNEEVDGDAASFVIFPARLRQANTPRRAAFLFSTPDTQQEFVNKMLALPGAEQVGEWIEVPSTEDWMLGLKTAHDLGGKLMPVEPEVSTSGVQSTRKESEVIIFPSGLRLPSAGRHARWLFSDYDTKEKFDNTMLDLPGAKRVGEWIDVETETEWKVGLKLARELHGVPDNQPEASVSVAGGATVNKLSTSQPFLPPVYTHPVFVYHPGDGHRWTMVFQSKQDRNKFILTMLDQDANMIDGWLQPQNWISAYKLTQQLRGIAIQLPRNAPINKMPKYTHVVDFYQAGSVKGQVLLFPSEEARWRFEEAVIGCWPGDVTIVYGWLEAVDSSVWFDGLIAAKAFGAVVLNMPEDRYTIY